MTTDELIVETRSHRTGSPGVLTIGALEEQLRLTLEYVLESIDYEEHVSSLPAQIARILTITIANLEDQRAQRQ